MKRHLPLFGRLFSSGLLLLLLAAWISPALARDFDFSYPVNPKSHVFYQSDLQLMTAQNNTSSRITLNAKIEGDGAFSVYPFPVDSGQGPRIYYFMVYYRPTFGDTVSGRLIVWDSTGADTVQLHGFDPSKPLSGSHKEFWLDPQYGEATTLDDTAQYGVVIHNYLDSAISVSVSLVSTGGWSFSGGNPSPITIAKNYNRYVLLHYFATGHAHDTAWLIVSSSQPFVQHDTSMILVTPTGRIDSTLSSRLTISTPYLGPVHVGDSDCATVSVVNPTGHPLTITEIERHWTNDDYSYSGLPTLPATIAAYDSITFTACFHPQSYHVGILDELTWYFRDSVGRHAAQTSRVIGQEYSCMTMSPAGPVDVGTILTGGYVEKTVTVKNENDRDGLVKLFKYYGTSAWSITSPTVFRLTSKGTEDVTLRFAPVNPGLDSVVFVPSFDSDCQGNYTFYGHGVTDASDSLAFNAPEKGMLAFRTDSNDVTKTFYFRNNATNTIRVTGLTLVHGTHFQITGVSPHAVPDTLASGDVLTVDVEFQGDTNGFYRDTLLVTTENALIATGFDIQAVRQPLASVRDRVERAAPTLTLQPMPVGEQLTLTMPDVQLVRYEIFDLLGNQIASMTSTGESQWSASGASPGTYIVRASGVDRNGNPFVTSRRFIKR